MTANCFTCTIADADMQVTAINRNRTCKTYNFKMTGTMEAFLLIGKAYSIISKTTHTGVDPAGFNIFFFHHSFNTLAKIFTGLKAKNIYLIIIHRIWFLAPENNRTVTNRNYLCLLSLYKNTNSDRPYPGIILQLQVKDIFKKNAGLNL